MQFNTRIIYTLCTTWMLFLVWGGVAHGAPCDPNASDVCVLTLPSKADPCVGGACEVTCDLNVASGTSSTTLDVTYDDKGTGTTADDEITFEGTVEDGDAFECVFPYGTGTDQLVPLDSTVIVTGTDEPDDIDIQTVFRAFIAAVGESNDRVRCDEEIDAVSLEMGDGDDWVSCEVDECAYIDLGNDDDSAIYTGPALSPGGGGNPCSGFTGAPADEILTVSGEGDDCVIGSDQGRDDWFGGSGSDEFDSRGDGGTTPFSDDADGGTGFDYCLDGDITAINCEAFKPSPLNCPSYTP